MTLQIALLLAVLTQGTLVFGLAFWLGKKRLHLVRNKQVRVADIALSSDPWPDDAKQAANAFNNQFQLPVLLYVAVAISLYVGAQWLDVLLAWAFVIARVVHALIHITTNQVFHRFSAYTTSFFIIAGWWIVLIIRVITQLEGTV